MMAPRGKRVRHCFPMRASHVAPFAPANHITRNDETKRSSAFSIYRLPFVICHLSEFAKVLL